MNIESEKTLFDGHWLQIKEVGFLTKNGNQTAWQYVERKGNPAIVTVVVRSSRSGRILLIRQPRVPVRGPVVEFPAGLVDAGESLREAALRELREETGYAAQVERVSPLMPKSAGLSTEQAAFVFCTADEDEQGATELEETEDIVSFWVHPNEFFERVEAWRKEEVQIAADVYAYFLGVGF